jgi:hypothetical protein
MNDLESESFAILKGDERTTSIELYLKELSAITSGEIKYEQLPLVFYLVHQL